MSGRSDSPDAEAVLSRRDRDALEPGELRHSLKERAVAAVNARLTRALDSRLQGMLLALGGEQSGLRLDSSLRWDVREGVQGGLDVFVPFFGDADSTWFLQPGFLLWPGLDGERRHDLNIGGGYRRRVGDGVAGGGVFYDHNVDSTLQRLGLSLDFRSGRGYGALNVYYSLTDWEDSEEAPGQREEHALGGLDLQLRYALTDALEVHGSLGMWEHYEEGSGEHKGLRPGGSFGVDYELLPGLSFGGSYEIADALGKDRYELGLRFVWPAQSRLRAEGGVADLYSVVKREKRILYARRDTGETDCGVELRAQVRGSPSGALSVGTQVEFSGRLVNSEGMSSSGLRCVGLGREFLVSNPVELRFRDRDGDGGYEGAELQGEVFVWRVPAPGSTGSEGFEYDVGSGSYTLRFRDPSGVMPESRIRFVGGDVAGDNTYVVAVSAGVSVVPQALTVDEGGSGVYTVQLNSRPEAEVSVTVLGATGDVTVSGSPLSFDASNWRTQQTVTVTAGGDADAEDDRVELSHRASSGDSDYAGVEVAGVTVTVTDTTPGAAASLSAVAGDKQVTLTWGLPVSGGARASWQYRQKAGSNAYGAWMPVPSSNAGTTNYTVSGLTNDTEYRFQVRAVGSVGTANYGVVSAEASATPRSAAVAGVTVNPQSLTVDEGDSSGGTYTVVLATQPSAAVTVTPSSDNADVEFTPATLSFSTSSGSGGWNMAQTVTVTADVDADADNDSATLTHGITGGDYASVDVPDVRVTVTDTTPGAVSSLSAVAGDAQVTLTWGLPVSGGTRASWQYRQKAGSDAYGAWTAVPSSNAGTMSHTVSGLTNDTEYRFRVRAVGSVGTANYGVASAEASATPRSAPVAGVTVNPQSLTVDEGDGTGGTYTVVLATQPSADVTVTPSSNNADVTFSPSTLTFGTGTGGGGWATAQTVTVTADADADADNDSATLTHGITGGDYASVSVPDVSVTVTDTTPKLTLETAPSAVAEGAAISVTVTSDKNVTGTLAVSLTLADRGSSGFTADDIVGALTRTFTTASFSGGKTAAVTIATADDAIVEGAETYRITLVSGTGYALGDDVAVDGVLNDNDSAQVTLASTTIAVTEGQSLTVPVTLSAAADTVVNGRVTLSDGTPTADFAAVAVNFSIAASQTSGNAVFMPKTATNGDGNYNAPRSYTATVTLTSPPAGVTVGTDNTDTVTVTDNTAAPSAGVTVSPQALTVDEGDGTGGTYTVVLATQPSAVVTVTPSSNNADVTFSPSTLTFGTGTGGGGWATAQTVTVTADADADADNDSATLTHGITGGDYASVSVPDVSVTVTDTTPKLTLETAPSAVAEGAAISVTVTSDKNVSGTLAVRLTLSDRGSSGFTADDIVGALTRTFTTASFSGGKTAAVTIATADDAIVEGAETYRITLVSGTGYALGDDVAVDGTLNDNDTAQVTLASTTIAVTEGQTLTVPVTLSAAADTVVNGRVTLSDGTPTADFAAAAVNFSIAAGDTGGNASFAAQTPSAGDSTYNAPRSYTATVTLTSPPAGVTVGSDATDTVTVTDNTAAPSAGVTVNPQALTVDEGDGTGGTYTVVLATQPSAVVTVTPSSNNADVTFSPSTLTFGTGTGGGGWATAQTVTVTADADADADNDSATLTHGITGGDYASVSVPDVSVTVTDTTPKLTLETAPSAVAEGAAISVTVTSDKNVSGTLAVRLTLSDRGSSGFTADDIVGALTRTFTTASFSGGKTAAVTIATADDAIVEGAETYRITLVSGTGYALGDDVAVDGTLNDNDSAQVTLASTTIAVTEGQSLTVPVTLSAAADTVVNGRVTLSDGTPTADFAAVAVNFSIAASQTSGNAVFMPKTATNGDGNYNAPRSYTATVTLTSPPAGVTVGTDNTDTVTVTDNTAAPSPGVTVNPQALTVDEGDGTGGTYTVVLATQPSAVVTVTPSSNNADVTFSPSTLTFGTGTGGGGWATAQTVTVTADADADADNDSATLTHGITGGDYASVSVPDVSVTVTDTTPKLTLETAPSAVAEGAAISVTVTSDKNVSGTLAVRLTLSDRGSSGFTADDIVGALTRTFTTASFSGGKTAAVTIATADDAIVEGAETYRITLVSGTGYALGDDVAVDGTLNDNDSAQVTLASTTIAVTEGQSLTVPVTLSAAADTVVNGRVTLSDGTPTADFAAAAVNFSIAASQTSGNAVFMPKTATNGDGNYNAPRSYTATVTLTSPPAGVTVGTDNTDTVTVTDNTAAPSAGVTVSPQALTVDEGDGTGATYTVVLATQPSAVVTVTPSSNNADVTFSPSTLTFGTGTGGGGWATAQTVTVTADADADADNDSATLTHGITGGDYASVSVPDVSVTVTDTTPKLTLETAPSAVAEGAAISVTVTSDKNVSGTLAVRLTLSDRGSSGFTADDIVGALTRTFTTASFSGGKTAAVTIATADDAIVEGAETYRITLVSGTGYALGDDVAVDGVLNDNDTAQVTLASTTIAVTEGQTLTVPVTMSAAADAVVNGRVTLSDGTPTADFAAAAVNFSIAAGDTGGNASFAAQTPSAGDSTYNAPRSYTATVTLTSPPMGVTVGTDNTDTVTVTDNTPASVPGVRLSATTLTVDEGDSAGGSYTVVLATQPDADVTVTVSSAALGDVTVSGSPLTFTSGTGGNWATAQTVTVTAAVDSDTDNDSVTLTHSVSGGATGYGGSLSIDSVAVTVTDTTPGAAASLSAVAGDAQVTLTWGLPVSGGSRASWQYRQQAGSNAYGAWTAVPSSNAGTMSHTVSGLTNDTEYRFQVRAVGSVGTANYGVVSAEASATPRSAAVAGVTVNPQALTVDEGDSAGGTYTVVLATQPSGPVTVTVGGTLGDVTLSSSELTFATNTWDTAQTVTVKAGLDADASDDSVSLMHTASSSDNDYQGVTINSVEVTVRDTTPVLQLLTDPATVNEGSAIQLRVTANRAVAGSLSLNLRIADRSVWQSTRSAAMPSGTDASDFPGGLTQNGVTAAFNGGTTATVSIATGSNSVDEGDDYYRITLVAGSGYTVGTDASADGVLDEPVTINDFVFRVSGARSVESSIIGVGRRDPPYFQWSRIRGIVSNYSEGRGRAGLPALAAGDDGGYLVFYPSSQTVSDSQVPSTIAECRSFNDATRDRFCVHGPSRNFYQYAANGGVIDIAGDTTLPTNGFAALSLGGSGYSIPTRYVDLTAASYTMRFRRYTGTLSAAVTALRMGTMVTVPALTLETAPSTVTEGAAISVTVTSDSNVTGTLSVSLTLADRGSSGFTADDIMGTLTQTFTTGNFNGGTTAAVTIATVNDVIVEGVETYSITLGSGTGYTLGSDVTVDGTLNDNDTAQVTLASTTIAVTEGQSLTVPVTLSAAADAVVNGRVTLSDGTPTADFAAARMNFSIAAGDTGGNAVFLPKTANNGDGNYNAPRSYTATVTLTSPPMGVTVGTDNTDTVTVTDNTAAPSAGVTVSPQALTVDEGSMGSYTVVLDTQPSAVVTVTPSSNNADVTFSPSTLRFGTGTGGGGWDTEQSVTVTAGSDADADNDSATLTHGITGGDYASVDVPDVSVTVTDTTPKLTLETNPTAVSEGTAISVTVTSDKDVTGTLSVRLTLADRGSSGFTADDIMGALTQPFTTASFGGGKTAAVTIPTVNDAIVEGAETYTITLVSGTGYALGSSVAVDGTLNDNDSAEVTLASGTIAVTEGQSLTVPVTLSAAADTVVNGRVTLSDGTPTADFAAAMVNFSIAAGDTGGNAVFLPKTANNGDSMYNAARSYTATVTLTSPPAGVTVGSDNTDTVTVTDNTAPPTPGVTLNRSSLTVTEEDTTGVSYTVVLNTAPTGDVTVTVSSAAIGDVTATPSELTFGTDAGSGGWDTAQSVKVTAGDDSDADNDSVTLTHTASSSDNNYEGVSINSVMVTVTDNDTAGVRLSETTLTVTEEDTTGDSYTVVLATEPDADVTVTVGGFTGTDVTATPALLTFGTGTGGGGWATAQTVKVTAGDDANASNESVTLTHAASGATGYTVGLDIADVEVSVTDNDTAGVTLSPRALTVDEGSMGSYTVVLDTEPSADVTVTPSSNNADVTFLPATLRFGTGTGGGGWDTEQSVTVTARLDADADNDSATLTHVITGGDYARVNVPDVSVTVTDTTPELTLETAPSAVSEGTAIRVTVTSDKNVSGTLSVSLTLADRGSSGFTADDIRGALTQTFTTASFSGGTTAAVTIPTVDDAIVEGAERYRITLGSGTGYVLGSSVRVNGTLNDNDSAEVTLASGTIAVTEGQTLTVPVTLSAAADTVVNGRVTLSDGTPTADFAAAMVNFSIAASQTSGNAVFTPKTANNGDGNYNAARSYTATVTLTSPPAGVTVGSDATDTVTVTDNTAAPSPGVTVSPRSLTVDEGDSNGETYTVVLDTQPSAAVTVTPSSNNADVMFTPATLTFGTGTGGRGWATEQSVTVTADADADADNDSATLTHGISGGDYATVNVPDVSVTVTDTTPELTLATAPSAVAEGTAISVTVTSDKDVTGTLSVRLTLSDRGSSGFTADDIRGALTQMFTTASFGSGKTAAVTIPTADDAIVEGAETYTITLVSGTGYALGDDVAVDGTLNDNDSAQVTLASTTIAVTEGQTLTVPVTMSAAADTVVNGRVTLSDGTPTADFAAAMVNFSIAAGDTGGNAVFTPKTANNGDGNYNAPRSYTATVTLTSPPAGVTVGSDATDTVTVTDNTAAPSAGVTLSETTLTVDEGDATGDSYTVVLATQPDADVTVTVSGFGSTDVEVSPSELTFASAAWNTAQTVTVTAAVDSDTADEAAVTLTHAASGATGYGVGLRIADVTVTVTDTTPGQPTGLTATAGDTQVELSWTAPGSGGSIASWQYRATTQTSRWAGASWTPVPSSNAGTTRYTVESLTNGSPYRFQVRAVGSVGTGNVGAASAEASATPMAATSPGVTVSEATLTVDEGDATGDSYTVVLATQPDADVTVTVAGFGSTDVEVSPSELTFASAAWDTAQTVTVTAVVDSDTADEAAVTLTHAASGATGYGVGLRIADVEVTVTDTTPGRPTGLTATAGDTQVTLSWTAPGSGGSIGSWQYRATTETSGWADASWTAIAGAGTTGHTVEGLTNGSAYRFQVRAVGSVGTDNFGAPAAEASATPMAVAVSPGVTLSETRLTMLEGTTAIYTVILNTAPSAAVTVTPSSNNADVTFSPATLSFGTRSGAGGWDTAQTVTVTGGQDLDTATDRATLTHSISGGNYASLTVPSVAVTVTDNDTPGFTFSTDRLTVPEGGSGSYTFRLNARLSTSDMAIRLSVDGSSDVTVNPTSIFVNTGNWDRVVTVTVTASEDDADFEDDEATVRHVVQSGTRSNYAVFNNSFINPIQVTVTDNDETPELTLSGTANGTEGGSLSLSLSSDVNISGTAAVNFSVQGSLSGTDRDAVAADFNGGSLGGVVTASFNNGRTATVSLPLTDDGSVEGDEGFRIRLVDGRNYDVAVGSQTLSGTLTDNDGFRLTAETGKAVTEGRELSLTLSAVATTDGGTNYGTDTGFSETLGGLSWSYAGGTAEAGDFLRVPASASFSSGTASVAFVPADDADTAEDYRIRLTGVRGHTLVDGGNAVSGTINPLEGRPVTVADATVDEGDTVRLRVTVTGRLSTDTTVVAGRLTLGASGDSATSGADYRAGPLSYRIPAGQTGTTVELVTVDDALLEGREALSVQATVTSPATGYTGGPPATVRIEDDERAMLSFASTDVSGSEAARNATLEVRITRASGFTDRVDFELRPRVVTGDDAAEGGADFSTVPVAGRFPANSSTAVSLEIPVTDDAEEEARERFSVSLSTGVAGVGVGAPASVRITDNDRTLGLRLPPTYYATEGDTELTPRGRYVPETLPLNRAPIGFTFSVTPGTAVAADYTVGGGGRGSLRFSGESGIFTLPVTIVDDMAEEGVEVFTVTLTGPSAQLVEGHTSMVVQIAASDAMVPAGEQDFQSPENPRDSRYSLSRVGADTVTEGGSVNYDFRYHYSHREVGPDDTNPTLSLAQIKERLDNEGIGYVEVRDGSDNLVAYKITNPNLPARDVTFYIQPLQLGFGEAADVSGLTSAGRTVSALGGGAYRLRFPKTTNSIAVVGDEETTLTLRLVVATADDDVFDPGRYGTSKFLGEQFLLRYAVARVNVSDAVVASAFDDSPLNNPSGGGIAALVNSKRFKILNNDAAPNLSVSLSGTLGEGSDSMLTLTGTLSRESVYDVTVPWTTIPGTAVAGEDYTVASGSLTVPAGETSVSRRMVELGVVDDDVAEGTERLYVALVPLPNRNAVNDRARYFVVANPTHPARTPVDITDNDTADVSMPPSLSLSSAENWSVGTVQQIRVSLSKAVDYHLRVPWTSSGSATHFGVLDVSPLEFAPGVTERVVRVKPRRSGLSNTEQDFTLTLSAVSPSNGASLPADPSITATLPAGSVSPGAGFGGIRAFNIGSTAATFLITFSSASYSGTQGSFRASSSQPGCNSVTGSFAISANSATAGTSGLISECDYTLVVSAGGGSTGLAAIQSTPYHFRTASGTTAVDRPLGRVNGGALRVGTLTVADGLARQRIYLPVALIDYQGQIMGSDTVEASVQVQHTPLLRELRLLTPLLRFRRGHRETAAVFELSGTRTLHSQQDIGVLVRVTGNPLPSGVAGTEATGQIRLLPSATLSARWVGAQPLTPSRLVIQEDDAMNPVSMLQVRLDQPLSTTLTVNWTTRDGSAVSSGGSPDYRAGSGRLVFMPGEQQKTVSVTTLGDTQDEGRESLFVDLSSASGLQGLRNTGETVTAVLVLNNDDATITASLGSAAVTGSEGGNATIPITLSAAAPRDLVLRWTATKESGDTADLAADLGSSSGDIAIAAGESSGSISIPLSVDDLDSELAERFTVTLTRVSGPVAIGSPSVALVTITNVVFPAPRLTLSALTLGQITFWWPETLAPYIVFSYPKTNAPADSALRGALRTGSPTGVVVHSVSRATGNVTTSIAGIVNLNVKDRVYRVRDARGKLSNTLEIPARVPLVDFTRTHDRLTYTLQSGNEAAGPYYFFARPTQFPRGAYGESQCDAASGNELCTEFANGVGTGSITLGRAQRFLDYYLLLSRGGGALGERSNVAAGGDSSGILLKPPRPQVVSVQNAGRLRRVTYRTHGAAAPYYLFLYPSSTAANLVNVATLTAVGDTGCSNFSSSVTNGVCRKITSASANSNAQVDVVVEAGAASTAFTATMRSASGDTGLGNRVAQQGFTSGIVLKLSRVGSFGITEGDAASVRVTAFVSGTNYQVELGSDLSLRFQTALGLLSNQIALTRLVVGDRANGGKKTVTIPAGSRSATVTYTTLDDSIMQGIQQLVILFDRTRSLPAGISYDTLTSSITFSVADDD